MRFTSPQWRPSLAKRRTPPRSVIDVSAFASVMFALLALLMGPSLQVVDPKVIPVDMPFVRHAVLMPDARREDALIVAVARDGTLYFGSTRVWPAALPGMLRDFLENRGQKTVYVKADTRAKYGDVKVAIDRIHDAGVTSITFLTETLRP